MGGSAGTGTSAAGLGVIANTSKAGPAGASAAAAAVAGITGNPAALNSEARLTANSRNADSLGSAMNLSTSSRATVENAGAGSRVKTRAADTLRGRFGPQSGQALACSSTRSLIDAVMKPVQPLITSARAGQS